MSKQHELVGKTFPTNNGGDCVVVKYEGVYKVTVSFLDDFKYTTVVGLTQLRKGNVKNLYTKSNYGVGYIGEGIFKPYEDGVRGEEYMRWNGAMRRCYDLKYIEKYPTYRGCTVSEEWHSLQEFGMWHRKQKFSGFNYHLDKDILVKGNKIYSPDTCCLVPQEINMLLTNNLASRGKYPQGVSSDNNGRFVVQMSNRVGIPRYIGRFDTIEEAALEYKKSKEAAVKLTASKFRSGMDDKVFQALMEWELD